MGRVISRTDALGQTTAYSYDKADRLTSVTSPNNLLTSYSYANNTQLPTAMVDQVSGVLTTTSYGYDGLNRLVSVTNPNGVVKYGYDTLNRRNQLQFGPDGNNLKTVRYGYDGLSRPITMSNWTNPAQTLRYDYSGERLKVITYPNGVKANYTFDGAGRLTNLNQTQGSNTIFSAVYALDPLGNRKAITETLNGVTRQVSYSYDELSRLIQEVQPSGATTTTHPITSTYTYDKSGNRLSMTTLLPPNTKSGTGLLTLSTTYTYNVASQLINRNEGSAGGTNFHLYGYVYTYDGNGSVRTETNNLSGGGGEVTTYGYDSRNRLTSWQKQAKGATLATARFSYDGTDNRLALFYNGQTTSYLQDTATGNEVVLQEIKGSSRSSFLYPLGSTSPLYQSDASGNGLWYHADGLGSIRALTNGSTGTLVNTNSYSAFGTSTGATGKADNTHLFAGGSN
ncbi:MAG: RHS repeat protein [Chloroflexi bacterium]|nr:RHS repeat protein [Chloroflexota bacterium]